MSTKRFFPFLLFFFMLTNFLTVSCHFDRTVETFLLNNINPDSDTPVRELNRGRRDVIQSYQSPRNMKVFDNGAEFTDAHTFEKENGKYVIGSVEDENVPPKATVIPAHSLPIILCRDLQTDLGRSVGGFTQCAVMNARPITVCRYCVKPFNDTVNAYQQLMNAAENTTRCKDVLFGKDRLEIAETMYKNVLNLWNQANCNSCYDQKNGSLDLSVVSNRTLNFFQALSNVTECFEHIKHEKVEHEKVDNTPNNTCSQCRSQYEHLGAVYDGIVKDLINNQPTEEVCADIADAMNDTHHLWNSQFKCKLFGAEVGYGMVVLTVSLSSVPILFYLAAKVLSNAETILLVLPKRKLFAQDSARLQK